MALQATDRRNVLLATGTAVAAALSGCSSVASRLPENDGDDSDGPGEDELRAAIEAYFDAGTDGDVEAFGETVHPASPMHPDHWEGSDWELTLEESSVPDEVEIESVTADATVEDVFSLEHADLWYEADELEEAVDSEEIAVVEVAAEELGDEDQDTWALATDDGEWKVLFASTEDDAPENPQEAFEPEIRDEAGDVVERVDWTWEQDGDDGVPEDAEWARVILTDDPGLEADTVRIESTIAGMETEFYDDDTDRATASWAGSWGSVQLHSEGDQIVVTAIDDGEETVVHRVHYES